MTSATAPLAPPSRLPGPADADRSKAVLFAAGLLSLLTTAIAGWAAWLTFAVAIPGPWQWALGGAMLGVVSVAIWSFVPLVRGMRERAVSRRAFADGDTVTGRAARHRATHAAWLAMGTCLPVLFAAFFALFLLANDHAVQTTFFGAEFMWQSLGDVAVGFWQNIQIAVLAEILVLVWGLLIALARLVPGTASRPIRWLATVYVDVFRAIPSIIVIYLVGFGLPLAQVPFFSNLSPLWAAVLALSLTYGAYVAEVYRSGIEGVHWSQVAASRSLGLSYGKTMRFVVVPQAVRRVMPPLLNDFIGLQKDTALVTIIGTVDAFTQAKIYASNYFNLSSVTLVAILFIIITIPQTRFVDRLIERDARKLRAKG